jgi:hypothetical protein
MRFVREFMMGAILKKLGEILVGDLVKDAFLRSLSYGIIFALIFTYVIGALVGVLDPTTKWPFFSLREGGSHGWLGILFVSFALLLTLMGYLSRLNVRDDLLTPLRRKLVGAWEVRSQSWEIHPDKIEFGWVISVCVISIGSVSGKLSMRFEIRKSDIFKDQDIDIVTTAFSGDGSATKLVYFHETQLELKEDVRLPNDPVSKIDFPFLGVLQIKPSETGSINFMTGHWYDINNGVYNLARRMNHLKGLQDLSQAVEKGAVTFGGSIEFKRIPVPPATPIEPQQIGQ